jgi:hypothetical protein
VSYKLFYQLIILVFHVHLLDGLKKIKQLTVDLTSVETNMVSLTNHVQSLLVF